MFKLKLGFVIGNAKEHELIAELMYLQADTNLYEILHLFESGRCHM